MLSYFQPFHNFWNQNPGMLYGLSLLLGIYAALIPSPLPLLTAGILAFTLLSQPFRLTISVLFFSSALFFAEQHYLFPEEKAEGRAEFEIASLSTATYPFGKAWKFHGTIRQFYPKGTDESVAKNIPCVIAIPAKKGVIRPKADCNYWINGTLLPTGSRRYSLAIKTSEPWRVIPDSYSFAELRWEAKEKISQYIQQNIRGRKNALFLAGLATGNFEDPLLAFEFSRFGLQHIMAISGFHFAIIAAILSFFLRFFFAPKATALFLIFFLSSYFLFLGPAPSILRAWVSILLAVCSLFMEKESRGLNSLGTAIALTCLYDPLLTLSIGFQFSVATTAAILLLYPVTDHILGKFWQTRKIREIKGMDLLDQHGYCALSWLRSGLALTVAVNLVALPMTLFFFQKFPWLSLLHNLFFPFLVSLSLFLLLAATLFSLLLPPLGGALHALNSLFTQWTLGLVFDVPITLDFVLRIESVPPAALAGYLVILYSGAIFAGEWQKREALFRYL